MKRAVVLFASIAILLGSGLRFTYLDRQLFWHDEAISMMRIVGTPSSDISAFFRDNHDRLTRN